MRFVFCTALFALSLVACGKDPSVEQQIIATLQVMEESAEAGEHFRFMGHLDDSFKAQRGSMDRREFHRFMIFQINQHRRLQAQFFPIHVNDSDDGKASASFRILVTGGGSLLPESGQLFDVETDWLLDGGDWMLVNADWKTAQLPDLPNVRSR